MKNARNARGKRNSKRTYEYKKIYINKKVSKSDTYSKIETLFTYNLEDYKSYAMMKSVALRKIKSIACSDGKIYLSVKKTSGKVTKNLEGNTHRKRLYVNRKFCGHVETLKEFNLKDYESFNEMYKEVLEYINTFENSDEKGRFYYSQRRGQESYF